MTRTLAIGLAAALALAGCSDDPDAPRYTCDLSATALLTCTRFGPLDDYGVGTNRSYCEGWGGTWGTDLACPAENLVASCVWEMGTIQYWYAGTDDLASIEAQCGRYGSGWTTYP